MATLCIVVYQCPGTPASLDLPPPAYTVNTNHYDDVQSTTSLDSEEAASMQSRLTYLFPTDAKAKRLMGDVQAAFELLLKDSLSLTSIRSGSRVLDVGAGVGEWAQAAGAYDSSLHIDAVDMNENFLCGDFLPNVRLVCDDIEREWAGTGYDLIYSRDMAASLHDWAAYVNSCFKHLKRGGAAEFTEFGTIFYTAAEEREELSSDHPIVKMMSMLSEECEKLKQSLDPGPKLKGWLQQAGFEGTTVTHYPVTLDHKPQNSVGTSFRRVFYDRILGLCKTRGLLEHAVVVDGLEALSRDDGIQFDIMIVRGGK